MTDICAICSKPAQIYIDTQHQHTCYRHQYVPAFRLQRARREFSRQGKTCWDVIYDSLGTPVAWDLSWKNKKRQID